MTSLTQPPETYAEDDVVEVLVPPVWATPWVGTTDRIGPSTAVRVVSPIESTAWTAPAGIALSTSAAEEVRELRDCVTRRAGLTRQDVARALGVDRRSLSGYVTGEIRPTEDRLQALRALDALVLELEPRFGARLREVLKCDVGHGTPLDLIAMGRLDLAEDIELAASRITDPPRVVVRRRAHGKPLYLHAREKWADRVELPTAGGVVRKPETYEQDLSEAVSSERPTPRRPRRKQI